MLIANLLSLPNINIEAFSSFQYGIQFIQDLKEADWDNAKVAIVSLDSDDSLTTFTSLYEELGSLSCHTDKGVVLFLGNIIGGKIGVEEILDFLRKKEIFVILISNEMPFISSVINSNTKHLTLIDSHLSYKNTDIVQILEQNPKTLNSVGYQTYYSDPNLLQEMQTKHFNSERLGSIKNNIEEFEPKVRDSQLLYFNLSSIRHSDFPATAFNNPNGFTGEEACRLIRYATMSDICDLVVLNQYQESKDLNAIGKRLLSQMIWYAIAGVLNRKNDYPLRQEQLTLYSIPNTQLSAPLRFYKSNKSDRWWLLLSINKQTNWISCSYQDYKKASQGELSNRVINALERYA